MDVYGHKPVMPGEAMDFLSIEPDGVYIDGTFGRGGHSAKILERLGENGILIGIDRDIEAIEYGKRNIRDRRLKLIHGDFRNLDELIDESYIGGINGILLDLGVSSPQLDDTRRGFSYMENAPLDMRMDTEAKLCAYDIVNSFETSEIRRILFEYGEERFAAQIAAAIGRKREIKPIETTAELVDIIKSAMPKSALREKQHPAKRSFQAIRIAVNDELGALRDAIDAAVRTLKPGGRFVVITFHSLEDRIVKTVFRRLEHPCVCPPGLPVCGCGKVPELEVITRKPVLPTKTEISENPRSRSAKLRAAKRKLTENQGGLK